MGESCGTHIHHGVPTTHLCAGFGWLGWGGPSPCAALRCGPRLGQNVLGKRVEGYQNWLRRNADPPEKTYYNLQIPVNDSAS